MQSSSPATPPRDAQRARLTIGPAGPHFDDWPALLTLLQRAFASMDGRIDPPSSLTAMDAAALRAKAAGEHLLLAHHGRTLAGCVFAALRSDCVYLGKLAVDVQWRGRGVARQLVDAAAGWARAQGRTALELQTRVELLENHRAFAALGFVKVGETAHPGYTRPTSITLRRALSG